MSLLSRLSEDEIIRRYIVVNSFDGVLSALGIIFAEFFAGISDPRVVILPGIGAVIALFVSGSWSAYAAELSEVTYRIKGLEKHLLRKLKATRISKEKRKRVTLVAFANGLSPALSALLVLSPFFVCSAGALPMEVAYYSSMALSGVLLFALGAFTGYVARESVLKKGLLMLTAAGFIALVFYGLAWAGLL